MNPLELGCDCANCPFASEGKPQAQLVHTDSPPVPKGIIFSDVPTRQDARGGIPLLGPVGEEFARTLENAKLSRDDLCIVPATACAKPEKLPDNKSYAAVAACKPWRDKALEGKAFIAAHLWKLVMGQYAYFGATGNRKGFKANRGFVDTDAKLTITWRPETAYFKNPYEWGTFEVDVKRFARAIRGELVPPPQVRIKGVDVNEIYARARQEGWVSYDIETMPSSSDKPWTGKDPTQARLRTLGFGWEDLGYSFFWNDTSYSQRKIACNLLADPTIIKVGINVVYFDNPVLLREAGVVVKPYFDLRDARRALSSTSKLSLAYQTTLYTDATAWKAAKDDEAEEVSK